MTVLPDNNKDLPLSTSDVKQPVQIRMNYDDDASGSLAPPQTVMEWWDEIVNRLGDEPALFQKKRRTKADTITAKTPWTSWTWKEYRANVDQFGKALLSLGLEKFDVVNILGFNAPEWFFAHFGAMAAGGVSAGIYATNGPDGCKYVSDHSKAKVVVVDGVAQLTKYIDTHKDLASLKALVMYGPADELTSDVKAKFSIPVYTFDEFLQLGKDVDDSKLKERSDSWQAGETCSLIYTSGTTGNPKAVMITNDNITWTVRTLVSCSRRGYMDQTDIMISYLPLSHIAAQNLDLYIPLRTGTKIYFAQPDALKGSLGVTLKEVRPTTFFAVPRVWEKIAEKLKSVAKQTTGVKKMLSTWAKSSALAYWEAMAFDKLGEYCMVRYMPVSYYTAQVLLGQVHKALGLDRCYQFYVGAAPIDMALLKYYASLDIPILEIFGQSESTGAHTANMYSAFKFGTTGRPIPGSQTRIDAQTGELQFQGRHVFAGYMGMPEKTNETIDKDGWLYSGDVVKLDGDDHPMIPKPSGFMSITGRIKELIITAGGENVPPVLIEEELKAAMPALANCMVIGDKRKFLSVLLCLTVQVNPEDGAPTDKLTGASLEVSKEIGSTATTTPEARDCPKWKDYLDKGVAAANDKATSRAQRVSKWTLLETDFTERGGELTPTLKLKRAVAAEIHSKAIEAMYA